MARSTPMNKLVRDKIVEIIQKEGKAVNFEVLNDQDYLKALKNKLIEEATEVAKTQGDLDLLSELADLQEVMDCLLRTAKISKTQLKMAQIAKNDKKGSFKKRHFIKD
jgi:predicted house-cleaning noncanonical NTP pyrophosphatase (MazG superfamily)